MKLKKDDIATCLLHCMGTDININAKVFLLIKKKNHLHSPSAHRKSLFSLMVIVPENPSVCSVECILAASRRRC